MGHILLNCEKGLKSHFNTKIRLCPYFILILYFTNLLHLINDHYHMLILMNNYNTD
jgi:hypothetical protein